MDERALVMGLLWFIAFLFSTTVHEAMHAFVAYRGGDPTPTSAGRSPSRRCRTSAASRSACSSCRC
jgi:hypothetical protein